jgi:hypothetical protein
MRRLALALAGIAAAAPLLGGSAPAQTTPAGDHAYGEGHVLETDFVFSSQAGPNGENLVGTLTTSGYLTFTATLTCGSSSGNAVVGGYRIDTGKMAGRGFLSAAVDNGPPRNGRPVDVTVYSGYLPRPPVNCPSPGEPPPPGFRSTGGGPFTRGDFTFVNAAERLAPGTPAARVASMRVALRPRGGVGVSDAFLDVRARICGPPGMALLRVTQSSSPLGRNRPVDVLTRWHDELPHDAGCVTHRIQRLLTGFPGGRRYTLSLSARTTGRKWSRPVVRHVDAG